MVLGAGLGVSVADEYASFGDTTDTRVPRWDRPPPASHLAGHGPGAAREEREGISRDGDG